MSLQSGSEWRFVFATMAGVLLVTSLPYAYAYISAPHDRVFMGIMLDVPDHAQYFSWMRELSQSHLASNKLTPEPNRPVFFNLLWWGLGRLAAALGLGFAGVLHILRVAATVAFLIVVYRLSSLFFSDPFQRRTAFLVVLLTSGFGWILVVLKYTVMQGELPFPLDVFIAEGNTFLCILGYPHFVAAALYALVFELVLRGEAKGRLSYAAGAGLWALFLGWQHAYDLAAVYGILFAYAALRLLRDRRIPAYLVRAGALIGAISFWPALYSVWLTTADPLWREVLAQFANADVFSPNLVHLPILLGPTFLLALYTGICARPWRLAGVRDADLFLRAWLWAGFLLIYLPVDWQVHMLNGWQIPLGFAATAGVFRHVHPWIAGLARAFRRRPPVSRKLVAAAFLLLIVPTNLYLFAWRFFDLRRHDYPYYLHRDDVAALSWLEKNADDHDVVLSSLTIGQYVPALTGAHAFLGHWAQTVDFYGKRALVDDYFDERTDAERRRVTLARYGVDYVLHGPAELQLGSFDPRTSADLALVHSTGLVRVYAVRKPATNRISSKDLTTEAPSTQDWPLAPAKER